MLNLTFGEQVKIILKRKGMTIKQLAELIEAQTGMKMSRQNLTQRLSRDNFQEQDMRLIAGVLEVPLFLSILEDGESTVVESKVSADNRIEETILPGENAEPAAEAVAESTTEIPKSESTYMEPAELLTNEAHVEAVDDPNLTIGDVLDAYEKSEADPEISMEELLQEMAAIEAEAKEAEEKKKAKQQAKSGDSKGWRAYFTGAGDEKAKADAAGKVEDDDRMDLDDALDEEPEVVEPEDLERGDIDPKTGHEYLTNTVRVHPTRLGYVQVYSRTAHTWESMTEWAFLGEQEQKKLEQGSKYKEPIYIVD